MHPTMLEHLSAMEAAGRTGTTPTHRFALGVYDDWLVRRGLDPLRAAQRDIEAFREHLAEGYRKAGGGRLAKGTQGTWLGAVKGYYAALYRRGMIHVDPARAVALPKVVSRGTAHGHLTQQEATAMIQSQAAVVLGKRKGTHTWALEFRNLAMLALGLATGRRRSTIRSLRIEHLDHERNEIRTEFEKGHPGRVLPVAAWALAVAKQYQEQARPVLLEDRKDPGYLILGKSTPMVCKEHLSRLVKIVQKRTVAANPDLVELEDKRLTAHSLRVTFATMMFLNGAGVRAINELLLHRKLSTTTRYTPLGLEDLRRACRLAHPRA